MNRHPLFLVAFLCALSPSARADQPDASETTMTCTFTDTNGDVYDSTFHRTSNEATSILKFNGVEMPALRSCKIWAHGNPRMGGQWRCPHGMAEIRFEVYPVFADNAARKPKMMRVIRWNGEQLFSTIETQNCK